MKRGNTIIRALSIAAGVVLIVLVAIQLVPVERSNPPVIREPVWDSPETRALARRACFDCHSHETVWPLYAYVAPASWLVSYDVSEARNEMNFSDWGRSDKSPGDIQEVIEEGEMPPTNYRLLHPEARLSQAEQELLIQGMYQTIGAGFSEGGEENEGEEYVSE